MSASECKLHVIVTNGNNRKWENYSISILDIKLWVRCCECELNLNNILREIKMKIKSQAQKRKENKK